MRPDHEAAQRQFRGQKSLGQLHQRLALAFNAVEVARRWGDIYHEQCLMGKLVGQRDHCIQKAAAFDVLDRGSGISAA